MNANPSPKFLFLQSTGKLQQYKALMDNPMLRESLDISLLEMQRRLGTISAPADMGGCAGAWLRLQGAQELLDIFYKLSETSISPTRNDADNLPSNVRTMASRK